MLRKLFPEREIYVRSRGAMRRIRLSTTTQGVAAVAALALVGILAVAPAGRSAAVLSARNTIEAQYHARLADMQSDYDSLKKRYSEAEHHYDAMVEQLSGKLAHIESAADAEAALQARLDAAERRLERALAERNEAMARLKSIETEASTVQNDQNMLTAREEQLRATLEALTSRLSETAEQRDGVAKIVADLERQLVNTQADLELTRARQEQVLAKLEEAAKASLGELEGAIRHTGVDVEAVIEAIEDAYSGSGGPFIPLRSLTPAPEEYAISSERSDLLLGKLGRVHTLRIALEKLPFAKPVKVYRFTSGFGPRRDPGTGRRALHKGMDMAAPRGTPVLAPAEGTVVFAGYQGGYGKVVKVEHPLGFLTLYAHLSKINVAVGERVEKGQEIALVGNTGRSFGSHLHYEIRYNGKAINPAKFIEAGRNVF